MADRLQKNSMNRAMAIEGIRTEKELLRLIIAIVDVIIAEDHEVVKEYAKWRDKPGLDLETLAKSAEYKIRVQQIQRLKKPILEMLKKSTNRMIVASIALKDN